MKNVSKLFFAFVILCAAVLTSCDKEVETSPLTVDQFAKATIKGIVYADLDQTNYGYEFAPAGSKVIITMDYGQLGFSTSGSLCDTVLVGSNGTYQYEVPSNADGVEVYAKIIDFVANQKQEFDQQHTEKPTVFTSQTATFNVKANDMDIQQTYMDDYYTLGEIYDWYTVKGTIYLDYDQTNGVDEKLPAGTEVTFNCNGWSKKVAVGADGLYTVSVPSGESIYVDYNFTLAGKLSGGTAVTFRFEGSEYDGKYYSDTKDEDVYLNAGVTE